MTASPLHHQALERLGRELVSGRIPVGAVVTLADLEARFLVSRTVAREIMRVLESLGMIRSRRRVGITVLERSHWKSMDPIVLRWRLASDDRLRALVDVCELRAGLQPMAAELACRRATRQQRERLVELAARVSAVAPDHPDFLTADVEFHSILLRASGNEIIATIAGMLRLVHTELVVIQRGEAADPRWALRYRRIAAAIAAGDEDMARRWSHEQARAVLRAAKERAGVALPATPAGPGVDGWSV